MQLHLLTQQVIKYKLLLIITFYDHGKVEVEPLFNKRFLASVNLKKQALNSAAVPPPETPCSC